MELAIIWLKFQEEPSSESNIPSGPLMPETTGTQLHKHSFTTPNNANMLRAPSIKPAVHALLCHQCKDSKLHDLTGPVMLITWNPRVQHKHCQVFAGKLQSVCPYITGKSEFVTWTIYFKNQDNRKHKRSPPSLSKGRWQ